MGTPFTGATRFFRGTAVSREETQAAVWKTEGFHPTALLGIEILLGFSTLE